jgi:hypothetical protein
MAHPAVVGAMPVIILAVMEFRELVRFTFLEHLCLWRLQVLIHTL